MDWNGKQVKIIDKKHPHYGEIGEVVGEEYLSLVNKVMVKVNGENNSYFADFSQLKLIR